MTAWALPPVRRLHDAGTDVDEGTEFMREAFTYDEPDLAGDLRDFAVDLVSEAVDTSAGAIQLDRLRHSMRMSVTAEPFDQPVIVATLGGRYEVACGYQGASAVVLAPSWDRFHTECHDLDVLCCTLDPHGVRRVVTDLTGLYPGVMRFTSVAATSPAQAAALAMTMRHVQRNVLGNDDAGAHPLVLAETFRHLATMMLLGFPNTALEALLDPTTRSAGRTEPATVRRAVEFIDANAHRDLEAGDPTRGDTVAAIAARWGFTHPGRFSVEYRRTYGCSPRETLRR